MPTLFSRGRFYLHGLSLISTDIGNYIHHTVGDAITYPFLNVSGGYVISSHTLLVYNHFSMMGLTLSHVNQTNDKSALHPETVKSTHFDKF